MTTKEINRTWLIKFNGRHNGKYESVLLGVKGAVERVGEDLFYKFINRAKKHGRDVEVCRLRRGVVMRFYLH